MRKYEKKVVYILFAIIISQVLCYYLLDSLFEKLNLISFIFLRISIAIGVYAIITIIFRKKILKKDIDVLFVAYVILIINITFFKEPYILENIYYNLNIFDLIKHMDSISSLIMAIGNIGAYIPIGVYIIHRFGDKSKIKYKYMIVFFTYILIIEFIQCVFRFGAFDVNDIILNSLGFYIGINFNIDNIKMKNLKEILKDNMAPIMVFFNICIFFMLIYSVNSDSSQFFIIYIFTGILNRKAMDNCKKSCDRIIIMSSLILSGIIFLFYSNYIYDMRIKEIMNEIE